MVDVAQLVRASDCGSEGRGFEPHLPPLKSRCEVKPRIFLFMSLLCASTPLLINKKKIAFGDICYSAEKRAFRGVAEIFVFYFIGISASA